MQVHSGEDLELDDFLELAGVLDEFDDFLLALVLRDHLGDVLVERAHALVPEDRPQVLNERVPEENEPLATAILEENFEEVVSDHCAVLP